MKLYEVINHLGEVKSYWNTYEEALADFDLEANDVITCRELTPFEVYTDCNFLTAVEQLEAHGLPKTSIAKSLKISRWTLDNWLRTTHKMKPAQMRALLHLEQAFN